MSTGDVFGRRWGRNGTFCVAAGPVFAKTVGVLAKGDGC